MKNSTENSTDATLGFFRESIDELDAIITHCLQERVKFLRVLNQLNQGWLINFIDLHRQEVSNWGEAVHFKGDILCCFNCLYESDQWIKKEPFRIEPHVDNFEEQETQDYIFYLEKILLSSLRTRMQLSKKIGIQKSRTSSQPVFLDKVRKEAVLERYRNAGETLCHYTKFFEYIHDFSVKIQESVFKNGLF